LCAARGWGLATVVFGCLMTLAWAVKWMALLASLLMCLRGLSSFARKP